MSCGCYQREVVTTHGDSRGGRGNSLYKRWSGIWSRCTNPNLPSWKYYGGRGITVCDEWRTYEAFRAWALVNGYDPALSLDRIDGSGDYEPSNCRWVTSKAQANNRRQGAVAPKPRFIEAWGETKRLYEWAADPRCVVSYMALKKRLRRGWNPERSMTEPFVDSSTAGRRGARGLWGSQ
jgi:hypothetical protein